MPQLLFPPSDTGPITMSSREIASLCKARHNDVVASIERLFDGGVLRESRKTKRSFTPAGGGRRTEVFDLTKRDSLVVVSGYNAEVRARIIDRWLELERAVAEADAATAPTKLLSAAEINALHRHIREVRLLFGPRAGQAAYFASGLPRYGFMRPPEQPDLLDHADGAKH